MLTKKDIKREASKAWSFLKHSETHRKVKKGIITTDKFFRGMAEGIDNVVGIPKSQPDFNLPKSPIYHSRHHHKSYRRLRR